MLEEVLKLEQGRNQEKGLEEEERQRRAENKK